MPGPEGCRRRSPAGIGDRDEGLGVPSGGQSRSGMTPRCSCRTHGSVRSSRLGSQESIEVAQSQAQVLPELGRANIGWSRPRTVEGQRFGQFLEELRRSSPPERFRVAAPH